MLFANPLVTQCRIFIVLVLCWRGAPSPALSAGCPERCVCDEQLVVQCSGQRLSTFPTNLPLATRQLIISNNNMDELPALQLNYLSDLVYLDCSSNSIREISESTFGNLRKLVYLDLSYNMFVKIEDQTFGPLASLVMLRLTDNPLLSEIHPSAFVENVALQVLDLSRNNLTMHNVTSLITLPALRSLGLSGNPWNCACEIEDLCLWMQKDTFRFQDEGQTVCEGPPDLRGLRLAELGLHLRTQCHPSLGHQDYLFFIAIGFVIFAAGTVLAWLTGVVMVLFERYVKRENGELDSEREEVKEEAGG
ncbi:hypothetical protein AALO_G00005460 [Alosa alosa]|uniref:Leucine rich repeat containing 52 n=1 Tax=Alosa alosa TaxID=278164 RepID=A0AAV6HHS1_9TELE|nr:leucine-rich repeat-containing protein 52-like [Alosa alosa]KAG5285620.1 hypothetical protein AALO_G00005460 [Alosa alosa]